MFSTILTPKYMYFHSSLGLKRFEDKGETTEVSRFHILVMFL